MTEIKETAVRGKFAVLSDLGIEREDKVRHNRYTENKELRKWNGL